MYQANKSNKELQHQLLIGLKKHLLLAQTTSESKQKRLESLHNLGEVLEYVLENLNQAVPDEEQVIYDKFFTKLLVKVKKAEVMIHTTPLTFNEEIGFISVLLTL